VSPNTVSIGPGAAVISRSGCDYLQKLLRLPRPCVGRRVVAKRTTGVRDAGERGVCDEEDPLGYRPGWRLLFASGCHDGFNPDDVELILEVTGEICPDVADYEFTSVLRLRADFRRGRFAPAFPPERRATVH